MTTFSLKPDYSRNADAKVRISIEKRRMTPSLVTRVNSCADQHAVTSGAIYLAGLAALLSRYSGESLVVLQVGDGLESLDFTGDPCFHELLARVAHTESMQFHLGDIEIVVVSGFEGVQLRCSFDERLFRIGTIQRLLQHFESLLEAGLSDEQRKVSELSFLPAEESRRLLTEWNDTTLDYPRELSIPQLLEQSATQVADACAVEFGDLKISYRELDARANQLARHLVGRGIGEGSVIGILLDRSIDMIVALLAVLKTGNAYLPLDPAFPASRLEFMAKDAAIPALITSSELAQRIQGPGLTVVLDREQAEIAKAPAERLRRAISPEALAYVLYTSGSTGKPKGVQIQHRSVINLLYGMQAHVELKPTDSLLAVTTLSFDIAGLELLLPMMTGSRLLLASHAQASDPMALRDLLLRTTPDLMQATPSTWRMLVDAGWSGSPQLKVLVGGEKVTREMADVLIDRSAAVWNCYGPTETTIWSTICKLQRDGRPVTIGRPLANTTLYILDSHRNLIAQGQAGELCIGGEGVARGYLNRPQLNAERFIANPFGEGSLYRTGDIVRYQPDGQLEILGRNDGQVKVRGFRIELGDVEEALSACPHVRAAAVVIRADASGEAVLAGYLEPAAADIPAIRTWLANRLPDYMVPTFLLPMQTLPMTLNGKIDRAALPQLQVAALPAVEEVKDRLEATLIGIWESVLGIRPVGRTQNFFDLGGHSVLAAKAFARMERTLGTALPLATLFQAPTVEQLAEVIRKSNWKPLWSSLVAIRPAGTKPPFFFVHPIGGNVLNFSGFCGHFGSDRPIYGLQARGLNGEETPNTVVEEMAADYIRGIRSVQPEGPYFIGGFSAGGVVAFEMAQQLKAAGQHVATLALLDTLIAAPHLAGRPISSRLNRWVRTAKMNVSYASQMRIPEFIRRKSVNFRMRSKLLRWRIREQLGLTVRPARLSAEEGFLLAIRRYLPRPYQGNATLFRAGDGSNYPEPMLGWEGLIQGHLDIQQVSGTHDTILQEPHIGMLARLLEGCLEKAPLEALHKSTITTAVGSTERIARLRPAIELAKS